jgi:hypothetical protein
MPSAASSAKKPLETDIFFLDRSLGKKVVANALKNAGLHVEIHDEHFPPDAEDEDWLSAVGDKGWVVLSKDRLIRYRANEKLSIARHGVRAFVLTSGNL